MLFAVAAAARGSRTWSSTLSPAKALPQKCLKGQKAPLRVSSCLSFCTVLVTKLGRQDKAAKAALWSCATLFLLQSVLAPAAYPRQFGAPGAERASERTAALCCGAALRSCPARESSAREPPRRRSHERSLIGPPHRRSLHGRRRSRAEAPCQRPPRRGHQSGLRSVRE